MTAPSVTIVRAGSVTGVRRWVSRENPATTLQPSLRRGLAPTRLARQSCLRCLATQQQKRQGPTPPAAAQPPLAAPLALATGVAASPLYRYWLQGGVVLLLLMGLDAGYSGDWSRIGVITQEQEAQIRELFPLLGCFHLACGGAAAYVSVQRGESWAPRVAKVLAVGFLALVEVVLVAEGPAAADDARLKK